MTHLAALALRPPKFLALVKKYMPITELESKHNNKMLLYISAADQLAMLQTLASV